MKLVRDFGNLVLCRMDVVRRNIHDEPGVSLKELSYREIPPALPEARRCIEATYAAVSDILPGSLEDSRGLREGDIICEENGGLYKLADYETASKLIQQRRCRIFVLRDLLKEGNEVDRPLSKRQYHGTFEQSMFIVYPSPLYFSFSNRLPSRDLSRKAFCHWFCSGRI